ncbi:phospholipase D-like domain-containing protein [Altererythrobacter sp. MF3-039]|uniref:phospholipase D-like domain-containing protein n=1 Tax=Altererythrobacter sp. MF3-039 TaxID=3252901 RepID=UPI00390C7ECF
MVTQSNHPDDPQEAHFHDAKPFAVQAQGHDFQFIPAGKDRLDALTELIGSARKTIAMCFYIFAEDDAGMRVRDALVDAAKRGVDVHLIIDGFGAEASGKFFERLVAVGGRYDVFSAKWGLRYLIRNHQKMVIVDRDKAMIGGFNVEQSYFDPPESNGWHDLGLIVSGEAVDLLGKWFGELEDWAARPNAQLRAIRSKVRTWDGGQGPVRLLIGGPTERLSSWASCVGRDLARGKRLDMVMAYFSPSTRLTRRIGELASRGNARLIMAGKSDNAATLGATRSLYHYLLKHGAEIYEFAPCKLHMKLIVIDDAVYVGSANFDMRSLFINLELMLRIEDQGLADKMRDFISQHVEASDEITPASHRKNATLWNRIRWNLSWFLVGVLDYTVSRRLNLGL